MRRFANPDAAVEGASTAFSVTLGRSRVFFFGEVVAGVAGFFPSSLGTVSGARH
jgi:hypothetical protein